jgi:hypothetical protein
LKRRRRGLPVSGKHHDENNSKLQRCSTGCAQPCSAERSILRPQFALRVCALGGFQKNSGTSKKIPAHRREQNMMQK